jgi:poly-gamma-glutamate capsule biosynthesis protein CapA/YwtB (metallophosphatase superfamily)
MYFVDVDQDGAVAALEMVPLQIRRFQLVRPSQQDVHWMQQSLDRESRKFGAGVAVNPDRRFVVSWKQTT